MHYPDLRVSGLEKWGGQGNFSVKGDLGEMGPLAARFFVAMILAYRPFQEEFPGHLL